eukprot:3150132-Pleurochrysis_carterae.AAC.5
MICCCDCVMTMILCTDRWHTTIVAVGSCGNGASLRLLLIRCPNRTCTCGDYLRRGQQFHDSLFFTNSQNYQGSHDP